MAGQLDMIEPQDTMVAEPARANPAYFGVLGGYHSVFTPGGADGEGYHVQIEDAYSFNLGSNLGVVEGSVRFEDFGTAGVFGGNPADVSYQIGAHY